MGLHCPFKSEFAGNPESCTLMYTAYSKEGSTAGSAEGGSSQLPTRPAAQDKESRANIRLQHEFYQVGCFFSDKHVRKLSY